MSLTLIGILACCPSSSAPANEGSDRVAVDCGFPGGNIVLEKIEGDTVYLHQDLRDTAGDWFYWYFRVRGAAGRSLTFQFTRGNPIGVRGPAISTDSGRSWAWLGVGEAKNASFHYAFPRDAGEVRFCFAIPYLETDLNAFQKRHTRNLAFKAEVLCRTPKGRKVELLRVGQLRGEPKHRVLLTARHHACESLASYELEGLLDFVLTDDRDGAWLRKHAEFMAIPFMDKDGVEDGDQGKNRRPHDHNRDYLQRIYPSVRALTERVPAWSRGKLHVALDLHCPHIRGPHNEVIYFVGSPDADNWSRVTQFAGILESVQQGPLGYRVADNLPFGQAWNTGPGTNTLQSFSLWAQTLAGIRVASTIELPYANAAGREVNADSARAFGRDLARALRHYLEQEP